MKTFKRNLITDTFRKEIFVHPEKLPSLSNPHAASGSATTSSFFAKDAAGNSADPNEAIFPILAQEQDKSLSLVGTGFFISRDGIFITASHVLREAESESKKPGKPLVGLHFIGGSRYQIRQISFGFPAQNSDVCVGCFREMRNSRNQKLLNKVLQLSRTNPTVGETIFTYAYPRTVVQKDLRQVHINTNFYQGTITEEYPNGRDTILLPSKCYQTNMKIHGGASGGPVFNSAGYVVGINSTGYEGFDDISFISSIDDTLDIVLTNIRLGNSQNDSSISIKELIKHGHIILR